MEKIIIDCHNHSRGSRLDKNVKWSDWFDYIEDFALKAKEKNLTMCAITEHDVVNRKLKELLSNTQIIVPEAVEISAKNYTRDKSLHILYYAKEISNKVDSLLKDTLFKKRQMLNLQLQKLQDLGFSIEFDEVLEFIKNKWFWEDSFNKWTISMFLFNWIHKNFNLKILKQKYWEKINVEFFYDNCMKEWWKFYDDYKVDMDNYEPKLKEIWELAKQDNAILSIAHPNFTFKKWIEEFQEELPYYLEKWVNAIELNAKISKDWVQAIMELKEKYNLILTFGSDCHRIWLDDDKHATFWTVSSFITQEILKENLGKFKEKIWI